MKANCLTRIGVVVIVVFTLVLWQSATAQPHEKRGKRGVPHLLTLWQSAEAHPPGKRGNRGVPRFLGRIKVLKGHISRFQPIPEENEDFAPVPKTGQTTNWLEGDDGDLQKGVPWPDPRFTDNFDGTVTDNLTALIWTQDANLHGLTTLSDALEFCSSCEVGDYTDWRLPNIREIESLIDYGEPQYPKLPAGHPFTAPLDFWFSYWSSTTTLDTDGDILGLSVSFENGSVLPLLGLSYNYVWCVRGGN